MSRHIERGWPIDRGPVAVLRAQGRMGDERDIPSWAASPTTSTTERGDAAVYEAYPRYLSPHAIQDLAWLALEGYDVFVRAVPTALQVRISEQPPPRITR